MSAKEFTVIPYAGSFLDRATYEARSADLAAQLWAAEELPVEESAVVRVRRTQTNGGEMFLVEPDGAGSHRVRASR